MNEIVFVSEAFENYAVSDGKHTNYFPTLELAQKFVESFIDAFPESPIKFTFYKLLIFKQNESPC